MGEMYHSYRPGFLEVICGCMFAGKTEELIRRIKVLEFAKKKIQVFKPSIDNRYSDTMVASHAGSFVDSILIDKASDIMANVSEDTEVVAIDEVQFLDPDVISVVDTLTKKGVRVMVAGLDTDFRGEPFPNVAALMAEAEFVTKLTAVCVKCGAPATRTQRITNGEPARYDEPLVVVGAAESYEARCRHCHVIPGKPNPFEAE